ncbi:MAG: alpha-galactosidase [Anaerolineaceae bacterium]|nr:MAG: alpha-galactosidase [Anaerolineaceae bacterium]
MDITLANQTISINATDCRPVEGGFIASASLLTVNLPTAPARYLYSGWQSWSLTAWVETGRPVRPMRPEILHPMQADPVYARETRPHGSWYAAVELPDGQILFLGALGLESHIVLDGQTLTGGYENVGQISNLPYQWFIAAGNEDEIFARYAKLLGERLGKGRARDSHKVWCSWYSLYTEIHEGQLLKILNDLGDLPFDVFQIDDGWQRGIGDWEPNAKFPSGMDGMAARIRATGRKAGLWLAPLLIVPSSSIFRDHRDWLLRDENGGLVSAGFNWGEQLYALDTTHPAALDWLAALMKKVRLWGYDYAKLDFLYAGALPGKRHVDMPREAAYRHGLTVIREALGDAYFLTCGAPILPSIGLCDALRVGPDVAGHWASRRDDDLLENFAAPGGRNALRTTLNRLWLSPLLHTDPDVIYFRSRQNSLTPEQLALLQDLAEVCRFKATSDIPAWLTGPEREKLRGFLARRPTVQKTGRAAYRIGDRDVDFGAHTAMPPLPGAFTNLLGAVIGGLAKARPLIKAFDGLLKASLRIILRRNPV